MNPRRLRGLMRKEALQIVRDPSAIAIAFVMPVVLLFIFGYGVSLDAHKVPLAVVVEQPTTQTASLIGGFEQSPYFRVEFAASLVAARARLQRRRVNGIVWLRADFSRKLLAGRAPTINVIVSGTDANNARILESYVQGVWQTWLTQRARAQGAALVLPVQLDSRVWFNPALRSRDFLVPGLIAIIMTLIGALLTALVVSREWERGTMEALFATPATMSEILLGKLIPYFLLGMGGMTLSVLMARWLFAVPLVGSALLLFAVAAVFMLAALGMGLLISTVARNQYRRRAGRGGGDLPAGVHAVGLHLRHRLDARADPVADAPVRGALFRHPAADAVSGRRHSGGDRRQPAGAAADGRGLSRPDLAPVAQAARLTCCSASWPWC